MNSRLDFIQDELWNHRTILLLGEEKFAKIANSSVLIVGLGGVGGFVAEFLCRAGIGSLTLCDFDIIRSSNRNRQIIALLQSEGRLKTEVMAERLLQINPELKLKIISLEFNEKNATEILSEKYDYAVDAIDSLSPKVFFIADCVKMGIPVVSSMGAGEKCDPALVQTCDIEDSYQCPLARLVRKRLHKLAVRGGVNVVFSPEKSYSGRKKMKARDLIGSISYMPAIFGIYCAAKVIKDLAKI